VLSLEQSHNRTTRSMLDVNQVAVRISRSKSWVWAAVKRCEFPAPIRLSSRCTRFDSWDVDRWIEQQFSEGKK
jgi:predicted DNA-binding transcriptional regulator AlpA